ncbi:isocitrate lyase/PEP mutase family protein [Brevundimonas albigilva]|uniref:isocitrate lyase/phosphoenolpyruvate mutase family protein n=1 Tax=Brevundimonas albigilva TaxID=1312364 RepID=UPI00201B5100|nr:isocitrate lyase/phosphoenolpyruvate mutase family protein [Brevundimonas albigilva]UQV17631.1 isocitrate lyase/PEP mutase family protein [Brevundimonas albigilva]
MFIRTDDAARTLKAHWAGGKGVRLMEAHNGLSAMIASRSRDPAGGAFDGIWVSSLTCTASVGLPDLEMSIVDDRLKLIQQIVQASTKPVIVDADTGGDVSSLRFLCRALAWMGVAGVIVEEKGLPKRNSLDDSEQALADPHEFGEKLSAAKAAVEPHDLLVIARIESLIAGLGVRTAVERALIYEAAGVDGILIHSKAKDAKEVTDFLNAFREAGGTGPVICIPTTYHTVTGTALFEAGFDGVIYANHQLRAAYAAMQKACLSILENDGSFGIENEISTTRGVFDFVGYTSELQTLALRESRFRERIAS